MLNPEQAQATLQALANPNWRSRRFLSTGALPPDARKIALAMLGVDEKGRELGGIARWDKVNEARREAQPLLDLLDENARSALFEGLFGKLAPSVQAAHRLLYSLPYETGHARKAFRAPSTPRATLSRRFTWLEHLLSVAGPYDQDVEWFATWAPYLGWYSDTLGYLFAGVIEAGGAQADRVLDILLASARGEHEIGAMGRHVSRALLAASRPEGWGFIEKMLLAAQRQEGLRQVILESVDEAHPQAFLRMLRLILDNDLVRFTATVRAVDVWLGLGWDSVSAATINHTLRRLLNLLQEPGEPARVLADEASDPESLYLALWSSASYDAPEAVAHAAQLLTSPAVERRFVGAHLLAHLQLPEAYRALMPALDDPDLRVAMRAFGALVHVHSGTDAGEIGQFEAFERLIARLPEKEKVLQPLVWPWMVLTAHRQPVASALLHHLGERPATRLIPYLSIMESWNRAETVKLLSKREKHDPRVRDTIFTLVGDPSSYVRERALEAVAQFEVTREDAIRFEGLLTRKAGDLRRGVISLLLGQPEAAALGSARRLTSSREVLQRMAGLELLRQMVEAGRAKPECRALAQSYQAEHATLQTDEEKMLEALLQACGVGPDGGREPAARLTLDDGLGLFDPAQRTPVVAPTRRAGRVSLIDKLKGREDKPLFTEAARALVKGLDDFVHAHRETPVGLERGADNSEELLGNMKWGFPAPQQGVPLEDDIARLPLRKALEAWWQARPGALRDPDGLEILRGLAPFYTGFYGHYGLPFVSRHQDSPWVRDALKTLYSDLDFGKLRYSGVVQPLLAWLLKMYQPATGAADTLLDAVETTFALVPTKERASEKSEPSNPWSMGWRNNHRLMGWLNLALYHRGAYLGQWSGEHHVRLWKLLRWLDEPVAGIERFRPNMDIALSAYAAGGATEADLLDQLIGPRTLQSWGHSFNELRKLSGRRPVSEVEAAYPFLGALVERCRERIIDVELRRGDMPTPASHAALSLRWSGGLDTLVKVLAAMGREGFVRGWIQDAASKSAVFSHLARGTFPGKDDSRERFAAEMRAARISEKRLLEAAMYAPQWAAHVEHAVGWPGLAEAVWWMHAHTKDTAWTVDPEIRESWTAQVSERTPLSGRSLLDGAVDVDWFRRVYSTLGPQRWEQLYAVAQYASGGGGHKRAQLFADAMLGKLTEADVVGRITGKRYQDAVRALGLLPLSLPDPEADPRERDEAALHRYKLMQEFVRTSKQFGSQRQASEKLAASIGMENLARTAGYPDPVRLEWAMEARAIEDMSNGPLTATVGGVTLQLAISDKGEAQLQVMRNDKPLKNIPPAVKKNPAVAALREREREVTRQASRMRLSLEGAMCRGDEFMGAELRGFFAHPVLRPMVERLVFAVTGSLDEPLGEAEAAMGYPVNEGTALRSYHGTERPVAEGARLRLAHPHDLLMSGASTWHAWQHDLFVSERVQPFKQVFRELYVLTAAERAEGGLSRRYEGHQVNPRQALALLGGRGWVNHPEEGVKRTFHEAGISAWVTFLEGFYTPAEVDGLTLEHVRFTRRGEWQPLSLEVVPPRVFSEVMRDLDLVVSVAHRGGVDPEASASTVEMRAALVEETCTLLGAGNVRVQSQHVFIEGKLGSYSIHLGSGVVHRQPGGALCIIPVHSQHRGRLFLPFADDDPKTAEVLSKVLLLARDTEIKDPTILEQLLAAPV